MIRPQESVPSRIPKYNQMKLHGSRPQRMSCVFVMRSTTCILLFLAALSIVPSATAGRTFTKTRPADVQESQAEPKTLRLSLTHSKAHASPDTRHPTLTDLVRHDRRRLESRRASEPGAWPRYGGQRGASSYATTLQDPAGIDALDTPLSSNAPAGHAQYVVDFEFGTTQTKASLIVDTGSDLLWTKCLYKSSTKATAGYYSADASSSFVPVKCQTDDCGHLATSGCSPRLQGLCGYNYSYADGSVAEGILANDQVTVHGVSMTLPFGCTDVAQGNALADSQGVLGLGRGLLSMPSQISYRYTKKFSYCFVDHLSNPDAGNFLVFGSRRYSDDERKRIQSVPLLDNPKLPTFYYVQIESLRVGGTDLEIPNDVWAINSNGGGGTVFDSGTSLAFLLEPAFDALYGAFDKLLAYPRVKSDTFPLCFQNTGVKSPYPELSIIFSGGATFQPPAHNYIIETDSGVSCLAILKATGDYVSNTIGNVLQQNFIVEYDSDNSALRFVQTDCSKE